MSQSQLQFTFKIETDGQTEEVTTKPGDIVAWELKHKETFLSDAVALRQMMWVAWRALYREQRTKAARFDEWFDTIDGFEVVDDPTEGPEDPTEAAIPEAELES